ncbi:hypothetical protein HHI36_013115 [Cryptolaemus montrouzieri]|uniref:Major facilitator superfamily (MFS) profile domain-containing protein n=1 Tax=Cryptolaemus montrouzieri TaxID=559131 RepID=A0ABD2NG80_9CUCU
MARVHPDSSELTMEDILDETGWGLYYKVLIGVVSACAFCQATALLALCFALPLGTCDPFMNAATILTVDMCFFFGKAIGGFLLNASSDVTGRLWLLPNSLMMMFCSTFLAAFSHSGTTLSVAMFILGSGLEANTRATKIHLAEILPKKKRGCYLTLPTFFWSFGYLLMIVCAWKLSHHAIVDHRGTDMRLTAWRLMFAGAGGCSIVVACVTALVQPSPRYRLYRKQNNMAQNSLKLFYAINRSKYSETWPHREQDIARIISDFQINTEPEPLNCTEQIRLLLRRMFKTVCLLFKKRFISTTVTLILMKILLFSGLVPIHLMLTKNLVSRNESCDVVGHEMLHLYPPVDRNCVLKVDLMVFLAFILLALNILVGQVIVFLGIDKVGRRFYIGLLKFYINTKGER